MSSIEVTSGFVKKYTKDGHIQKYTAPITDLEKQMAIHTDGLFPEALIGERRPNESDKLLKYRKEIFESQTKGPFSKILNSLGKIRRSEDWSILYPSDISKKVPEGETLYDYCEVNYPGFGSVTNWMFAILLKEYLKDPNGVIVVMPKTLPEEDNEFLEPIATVYNSHQILEYHANDYAVLKSKEKNKFIEKGREYEGRIIYIITDTQIWVSKEINTKGDFSTELFYEHDLGYLPVRKIRAVFKEQRDDYIIYESRISPCLASWNEAAREYSDMQASVVTHLYPTLVMHTNQVCGACNGVGQIQKEGKKTKCTHCDGKGFTPTSPYQNIELRPQKANEVPLPSPIAYYIDKDTEIITIQDERIDKHLYKAYASVNFEFLAVQLNQSGVAKEFDRGELNAFIHDIAEDLINIMDDIYKWIADYRYGVLLSEEEIEKMLPEINVPVKYDVVGEGVLQDEISKAKSSKVNPFIVNQLELDYASKKFSASPKIKMFIRAAIELNPLSGLNEDDKMVRFNNNVIKKEDYIISTYIDSFLRRADDEHEDFFKKKYQEKLDILRGYAKEIDAENTGTVSE